MSSQSDQHNSPRNTQTTNNSGNLPWNWSSPSTWFRLGDKTQSQKPSIQDRIKGTVEGGIIVDTQPVRRMKLPISVDNIGQNQVLPRIGNMNNILLYNMGLRPDLAQRPATSEQKLLLREQMIHQCAICALDEQLVEENGMALPCGHSFHNHCLNEWLKLRDFCPLCRAPLRKM